MKTNRIKFSLTRNAVVRSYSAAMAGCLAATSVLADSVVNSKHNLSVSGPGTVRAAKETQVCIFCHTPHNATSDAPLWNRYASGANYIPYNSTTTRAIIGQPTGASKLCLSCHDGTIALGKVRSRPEEIQLARGVTRMPLGPSNLGTDLSDDHPISFRYDSQLAKRDTQIFDPVKFKLDAVHLDAQGQMQCTSCHNPHDDRFGMFLVKDNSASALCITCHYIKDWQESDHARSTAAWNKHGNNPWPHSKYLTVAENACENCHAPHTALTRQRLLNYLKEEDNCFVCHNGNVAVKNIEAEFQKLSTHPVALTTSVHDPSEDIINSQRHVECADCHNPHETISVPVAGSGLPGALRGVAGENSSGVAINPVQHEYELCFRCHADSVNRGKALVKRQFPETNTRIQFAPSNASYHPVEMAGKNPNVPSLLDPYRMSSVIACTDCHNSDSGPGAGGNGPKGPHGSIYRPLLERQVTLTDGFGADPNGGALCFKCHSRDSIMTDQSFPTHSLHINAGESCVTCHDPHGVALNTKLINFNTDYALPFKGMIQFTGNGTFSGTCTLTCHGHDHDQVSYSAGQPNTSGVSSTNSVNAVKKVPSPKSSPFMPSHAPVRKSGH